MKITKTQLQNIIREELDALSEDEQLDEFFGFGKKAKAKAKAKAAYDAKQKQWAQEEEEAEARMAAGEKEPPPKRGKSMQFGGGSPEESDWKANKIARDRQERQKELERRKSMERKRKSGTAPDPGYARKTQYYGVNIGKDESKVRQRIREEVAKAVKAHFDK